MAQEPGRQFALSEQLDALGAVGHRDHEREPVAFQLLPDFAPQVLPFSFVKPDHGRFRRKTGAGPNRVNRSDFALLPARIGGVVVRFGTPLTLSVTKFGKRSQTR